MTEKNWIVLIRGGPLDGQCVTVSNEEIRAALDADAAITLAHVTHVDEFTVVAYHDLDPETGVATFKSASCDCDLTITNNGEAIH